MTVTFLTVLASVGLRASAVQVTLQAPCWSCFYTRLFWLTYYPLEHLCHAHQGKLCATLWQSVGETLTSLNAKKN